MSESLFSGSWYRVQSLKPRLRGHARIHRHLYRGRIWYVLQDHSSGRFHRFSPVANLIIGLMDGRRTLKSIWETACTRLGDDAPTQDEVINILATLHRADVLQTDAPPDIVELQERTVRQKKQHIKQYIQNPLALRIPLLDPEPFVRALAPFSRIAFSWFGALVWLVVVGWALALAGSHWNELTKDVTDQMLSADNLLLMGLVFPVAKVIHEFGHALAVKARGGEVHEMGVMLLVLMPVPYVDASASLAFRNKVDRVLVGGAGMLSEIFLAAIAMFVWANVEPGLVRAAAYNVIIIAGISTLVFNINPLLRFDGYYILADLIEIPNLGQRANTYLGYLVRRYLFGIVEAEPGDNAKGERPWFVFYSIGSFLYRMTVMVGIALLVAERFFFVGVLLATWAIYSMLVLPLAKRVGYLFEAPELGGRRAQVIATMALFAVLLGAIVFWLPAPSWTRADGVTVAPENAQVRAGADGFVHSVVATERQAVRAGDPLVVMEDPELLAQVRVFEAQLREQQARLAAAFDDRVLTHVIREEIAHITSRLAESRRRAADLTIRSPADGVFVMPASVDAPGRFVRRGEVVAHVLDLSRALVQVVVPQGEADLVRNMTSRVELRLVDRVPEVIPARVRRVVPAATDRLPSLALSAQGGGDVTLDSQAANDPGGNNEPRAASTLFVFELELPEGDRLRALGSRIYARFERVPEPLGRQWFRAVRQVLLKRFNV